MINCQSCKSKFSNILALEEHNWTMHAKNGKYQCGICKIFLNYAQAFENHMRMVHHTTKCHKCLFCYKAYEKKERLDEHQQGHKQPVKMQCFECKKLVMMNPQFVLKFHREGDVFRCVICVDEFKAQQKEVERLAGNNQVGKYNF